MGAIEKHFNILDVALTGLVRRKKFHFFMVSLYFLLVFFLASMLFFARALRMESRLLLADAPDMVVQAMMAGRHDLIKESCSGTIENIRGVNAVTPRKWGYYYHPVNGLNYTLMAQPDFPHGDHQIVTGSAVMDTWEAVEGRHLFFTTRNREGILLEVVNTFCRDSALLTADLILMSEACFKKMTGFPEGYATDLAVFINNPLEASTIARKTVKALPGVRTILRTDMIETYDAMFDRRSGMGFLCFSGLMMAFLFLAWHRAAGFSMEECREMGILRAVGWEVKDVLVMKLWEGAIISVTAFLGGCLAAALHVFWLGAPLFARAFQGWAVLYPEIRLPMRIWPEDLFVVFALTVFPYIVVVLIPGWRTAITDTDQMMRGI